MSRLFLAFAATLALAGPAAAQSADPVDKQRLSDLTRELSSDAFEGRLPGSAGEQKTVDWIIAQYKALGLEPGGENGGWTQAAPLVRFQVQPRFTASLTAGGTTTPLRQGQEVMVNTLRPVDRAAIQGAPLVFVGYGVTAPERGWDDFKGVDLAGKVAVFLINDPDFEAKEGDAVAGAFGGRAATYYARWTYKFEEAARRGALGALIVHETAGAAYGWSTVIASNGESFDIARADAAKDRVLMQGWMQRDLAVDLFRRSGLDFEVQKAAARRADFKPVALAGAALTADYAVAHAPIQSRNVIGKLTGSKRPNETVMFAAHWDAYGVGAPDAQGRTVRPGALDDAIGVAGVLEAARVIAAGPRPARTTVFAAWTAEERGLLGSEYYANNPLYPAATMAANFTMDVMQPLGASRDVILIGYGQNELEDALKAAAAGQGRTVTPDALPERGLFYRADHFSLAKRGVPTLLIMALGGEPDLVNGGRDKGRAWVADYTARCYHQTCDAWSPDWDLTGAAQDVALIVQVGRDLADSDRWPGWKSGSEFAPVREADGASWRREPVVRPDWTRTPRPEDVLAAYPQKALQAGIAGRGDFSCEITAQGTFTGCVPLAEGPSGHGFGEASVKLAPKFRMKAKDAEGEPVAGRRIRIPVGFRPPG